MAKAETRLALDGDALLSLVSLLLMLVFSFFSGPFMKFLTFENMSVLCLSSFSFGMARILLFFLVFGFTPSLSVTLFEAASFSASSSSHSCSYGLRGCEIFFALLTPMVNDSQVNIISMAKIIGSATLICKEGPRANDS